MYGYKCAMWYFVHEDKLQGSNQYNTHAYPPKRLYLNFL